jgi:hypothetical protein
VAHRRWPLGAGATDALWLGSGRIAGLPRGAVACPHVVGGYCNSLWLLRVWRRRVRVGVRTRSTCYGAMLIAEDEHKRSRYRGWGSGWTGLG